MQCCVPFCGNTSSTMSTAERTGITFHGLPSDTHVRAAWLKALGTQDHHLSTPAVVCSQHFLDDDFYVTESCVRQIHSDAIPSKVLMCMMCLDTNSKLFLMSKHKLDEVYEQLTGLSLFQLCRRGNLKQTLCVLCAQRLINFSRFRDLSLRAHSLMTDLVEQHGFMTTQHIELANNATEHLKCNLTQTTLATNHCDLYIDHTDEEEQTAAEESAVGDVAAAVVKNEDSSEPMLINDYYLELTCEDDKHIKNTTNDCVPDDKYSDTTIKLEPSSLDEEVNATHAAGTESCIKSESAIFECTFCFEEFVQEDDYNEHMRMHLQNAGGDAACGAAASCSWDSLVPDNKAGSRRLDADPPPSADSAQGLVAPLSARLAANKDNKVRATEDAAAVQKSEQILETSNQSSQSDTKPFTDINRFTNGVDVLDENAHMKPHTGRKLYSCDTCNFKTVKKPHLSYHKRTHTGEKPYSCDVCNYTSITKSNLLRHQRTHTGEKPYSCDICNYESALKSSLLTHIRTHTGEKPFSCDICNYKTGKKTYLLYHKRIHTGEKPFSCDVCNYRCIRKSDLSKHIRTHSGEKPYSCETCNYKCAKKSHLLDHKRTHTGEKPYSCDVCNYKSAVKSSLLAHIRTHTGEKPYSCDRCNYKTVKKTHLLDHKRTHTGEKPYSCDICNNKFAQKSHLLYHRRTHTGEKLYSCDVCSYKCTRNHNLVKHKKTHQSEDLLNHPGTSSDANLK